MIAYPWAALYTGVLLILAGGFTLGRHYLFEPMSVRYPKAPFFVRQTIFAYACVQAFLGLQYVWTFFYDERMTSPPMPGPAMQFLATALVINNAVMLWNVWSQRLTDNEIKIEEMKSDLFKHIGLA